MRNARASRIVVRDENESLWGAVRDGVIRSSDLSPDGKLRVSSVSGPPPPVRSVSPPGFRGTCEKATQTDELRSSSAAVRERLALAEKIVNLLVLLKTK